MTWPLRQPVAAILWATICLAVVGCGTTRSSDTGRTATEQLLISDAIDRAVQSVDLKTLAGQSVYFDDTKLGEVVDRNYLISTMRQHLLANGCRLRDQRDQADFIVEARAGAVGTDRNDLLFGVPSTNVPQILPVQPVPGAVIPEIPIAKRRDQKGIAKLAVFAYHRETGTPVWQSGLVHQESSSNDVWILGAGPFQRGSIYEGTAFAGKQLKEDEAAAKSSPKRLPSVAIATPSTFTSPKQLTKAPEPSPPAAAPPQPVVQASHEEAKPAEKVAESPPAPEPAVAPPAVAAEAKPAEAAPVADQKPVAEASEPRAATPGAAQSVYLPAGTSPLPQPRFESR